MTSTLTTSVIPSQSSNLPTSTFMTRRNSSQQSIPPPLNSNARTRTTSLFTSVTSPLFSGRIGFGTSTNSSQVESSTTSQSKESTSDVRLEQSEIQENRQRVVSSYGKGKRKESLQSNDRVTKPPKSKSALIAKRLSTPTSPALNSQFTPSNQSRWSEDSVMAGYSRKAETFSKSTPDLSEGGKFQPWPTLDGNDQESVERVDVASKRRSRVLSGSNMARYAHKAAKSFSSILLPTSPKSFSSFKDSSFRPVTSPTFTSPFSPTPHSQQLSTDEYLSQSIHPTSSSSQVNETSTPYPRIPSPSPSPTSASRLAARAEALAKLTEPPPIISLKRKVSPAPDNNSLVRPPLAVIGNSSSSGNERKSLSSSDVNLQSGKEGASRWSDDTSISGMTPTTPSRLSTSSILSSSYNRTQARSSQNSSRDSESLPPRPKKASARTKSFQQRAAVLAGLEEEIVKEEVRKARVFLEGEFGSGIWESKRVGMEKYEKEDHGEEENLWSVIRNGVLLCRLLNQLELYSPPILSSQIDRRGDTAAATSNLELFLDAAVTFYNVPSDDLFLPSDLQSSSRLGLRKVIHSLSIIESIRPRSAPTSTILPLDINLRGRVVRARSMNIPVKSTSSGESHGIDSLLDHTPPYGSNSPDSSSYGTDSPSNSADRKKVVGSTSTRPSITFADRIQEREMTNGLSKNSIYSGGDRRMTESAIDVSVLSIVEEDELSTLKSRARFSQPVITIDTKMIPQVRRSSSKRYQSSDVSMRLESPDGLPIPRVRSRNSSEIPKPTRLTLKRSMSNITTAAEAFEHQELVPSLGSGRKDFIARRSNSNNSPIPKGIQIAPATYVPFPSTPSPTSTPPRTPRTSGLKKPESPSRPSYQHKRWNSELYVDTSASVEDNVGSRTRHESLANNRRSESGDREENPKIARPKLVLREAGRPTLTYQLGECIGKGQFGSVYRALNLNSGRVSAVKRIGLEGKTEEEVLQLSNEVSLLRSLVHPAVVQYEGLVRTEHYLNIILEYVENGSLQKTIKAFGELPEGLVASYAVKILEGLSYLHQQNVVHCDLKAANILSTKQGNIKLADFGVSLNLNAVQSIAQEDQKEANGTPYWMAPEVIQLQGASTPADIWSLACTIIELVTGRPPYFEMLPMSAMFRIVEDETPPIPPKCSPELVDFLTLCFAKDPRDRPTADELFNHVWLQKNWDPQKDLRPQDSIPFLRRISTELRRPEFDVYASPLAERFSPSPGEYSYLSTSVPNNPRSPFQYLDAVSRGSTENVLQGYRASSESPRLGSAMSNSGVSDLQLSPTVERPQRPHAFVKTTFSKVVECRICGEFTKKHAVLCSLCGIICHSRCESSAPSTCDLRSQLLNYSSSNERTSSPLSGSPASLLSPIASPTSSGFNLAVILPFSKRKPRFSPPPLTSSPSLIPSPISTRSRNPSPSNLPQDLSSLPPLPGTPPLRPSPTPINGKDSTSSGSRTRLSDLIARRSPATTPTSSIRSKVESERELPNVPTAFPTSTLNIEDSPIAPRRGVISFSEGGGLAGNSNQVGANKLAKRKSHRRSQSGGLSKKSIDQEGCSIM